MLGALLAAPGSAAALSSVAPADCFTAQLAITAAAARRQDVEGLVAMAARDPCPDQVESWRRSYLAGFVNYRLADTLMTLDRDGADPVLDTAIEHLKRAASEDESCAACQALLASAYGSKIALRPLRGMRLGAKAGGHMKEARKLGRHEPVVTLLDGIDKFYTPRMFGGGLNRSRELLAAAVALFEAQSEQLGWNLADARFWYATALLKADQTQAAIDQLRLALEIDPEFDAARAQLSENAPN